MRGSCPSTTIRKRSISLGISGGSAGGDRVGGRDVGGVFLLPLALRIHQGFRHLGQPNRGQTRSQARTRACPSGSCRWPCSSLWARMPSLLGIRRFFLHGGRLSAWRASVLLDGLAATLSGDPDPGQEKLRRHFPAAPKPADDQDRNRATARKSI